MRLREIISANSALDSLKNCTMYSSYTSRRDYPHRRFTLCLQHLQIEYAFFKKLFCFMHNV